MREFNLYIDVDSIGRLDAQQQRQLRVLVRALSDRRINIFWMLESNRRKAAQIVNILSSIHAACKKQGVIIHSELCALDRKVTLFARILMRYTPISLYFNVRDNENDYACLKYANHPTGCMFNSCLGNTLFLKRNGDLSICPRTPDICLNRLNEGDSITSAFDTEDFKRLLLRQITKRNHCKKVCRIYHFCHSGCPMQEEASECSILKKTEKLSCSETAENEQKIIRLAGLYRG